MTGHEAVYAAAQTVLERGFVLEDSVFTPGREVWTKKNAQDLAFRLEHPPVGASGTFLEKLRVELGGALDEVVQLAAEILFLHYLPASDIKGSTKRVGLRTVLSAASRPISVPAALDAALDGGFMRVGVAFKTYRAQQVTWLAQVVAHVKDQPPVVRHDALRDPWAFRSLLDAVPTTTAAGQRRALLRLAFPEVFLDSMRADHLRAIVDTFQGEIGALTGDDERDFAAIRAVLEAREGPIDFLRPPWAHRWGRDMPPAAPAVAAYRPGWLVRGANVAGRNLVPQWLREGFCAISLRDYPPVEPGLPRSALAGIVREAEPDLSPAQEGARVTLLDRFLTRMAPGDLVVTVNESRVHVGALTGDPVWVPGAETATSQCRRTVRWLETLTLRRSDLSDAAQDRLSGQASVVELGEVAREIADLADLADLDSLDPADVASGPGTPDGPGALDDVGSSAGPFSGEAEETADGPGGLPAGGAVPRPSTVVVVQPPLEELPVPTAELATRLLVDLDWLAETADLLTEKKQLVLYGPPGTGKTYLAQELARFVAEETNGEHRLVQFHPSYAYEDFVEGFRPGLAPDGTFRFAREDGPLRRLVRTAVENPSGAYVLVIDEINRANLAKVFGELYFLLEYRNRTIELQYSAGEPFRLPPNVFLIGTMNTADRSIALVDAAMRRRFAWQGLFPGEVPVADMLRRWLEHEALPIEIAALLDALNAMIGDRDAAVGPSYLMNHRVRDRKGLERIWRTQILPLLEERHLGEHPDVAGYVRGRYGLDALYATLAAATSPSTSGAAVAPPDGTSTSDGTAIPGGGATSGGV
ncbi:AAA family ATPase [Parafrankia sp. FMc2]|uniref:AAA family ATPase n=1 Tax=Parafrankia sp. FMc2 TaxID=3233196 RepID=UPI0034D45941